MARRKAADASRIAHHRRGQGRRLRGPGASSLSPTGLPGHTPGCCGALNMRKLVRELGPEMIRESRPGSTSPARPGPVQCAFKTRANQHGPSRNSRARWPALWRVEHAQDFTRPQSLHFIPCHTGEGRYPWPGWIPAFAGMTGWEISRASGSGHYLRFKIAEGGPQPSNLYSVCGSAICRIRWSLSRQSSRSLAR